MATVVAKPRTRMYSQIGPILSGVARQGPGAGSVIGSRATVRLGVVAGALLAVASVPASGATHRILMPPGAQQLWVATRGGAGECAGGPQKMTTCPKFRPVGASGKVDLAGKLICIVLLSNKQYRKAEYFVDPVHDVLPHGGPITIQVGM